MQSIDTNNCRMSIKRCIIAKCKSAFEYIFRVYSVHCTHSCHGEMTSKHPILSKWICIYRCIQYLWKVLSFLLIGSEQRGWIFWAVHFIYTNLSTEVQCFEFKVPGFGEILTKQISSQFRGLNTYTLFIRVGKFLQHPRKFCLLIPNIWIFHLHSTYEQHFLGMKDFSRSNWINPVISRSGAANEMICLKIHSVLWC